MSIKATIELEETRLLWSQTTKCQTKLINGGDKPLLQINPENRKSSATISLTNVKTGETVFHAESLVPNAKQSLGSLEPRETLEDKFDLATRFQFPACGIFDLRVRYEWLDGNIESNALRLEVLPANPQSLSIATKSKSKIGDVFSAWVNKDNNGFSIWLNLINIAAEPHFVWARKIETISKVITPFLSVPTNTNPQRQYLAWISGNKLNYVIFEEGHPQASFVELDADDYVIIPPLLEDFYIGAIKQPAEILLLKKNSDEWQIQVVMLGKSPTFSKELKVRGAAPEWFQTIYRSNGDRYTFILMPQSREGNPYTKLAMTLWKAQVPPSKPIFLHNLQGSLIAADVFLSTDDRIFGAALIKQQSEFVIQKWQLDKNDELTLIELPPLLWNYEWTLKSAVLRVNGEGIPFMLLKGGPESKWFWMDDSGEIISLGEFSSKINLPADIIFVGNTFPTILYTDETCGLKFYG